MNKIFKKIKLLIFVGLSLLIFVFPEISLAQSGENMLTKQTQAFVGEQGAKFGTPTDVRIVILRGLATLFGFVGILFLVYMVYAGYLILSSAGDEDKVRKGKETIRTAVIGVFVAFAATGILTFVGQALDASAGIGDKNYFEAGISSQPYDACRNDRGDLISCP